MKLSQTPTEWLAVQVHSNADVDFQDIEETGCVLIRLTDALRVLATDHYRIVNGMLGYMDQQGVHKDTFHELSFWGRAEYWCILDPENEDHEEVIDEMAGGHIVFVEIEGNNPSYLAPLSEQLDAELICYDRHHSMNYKATGSDTGTEYWTEGLNIFDIITNCPPAINSEPKYKFAIDEMVRWMDMKDETKSLGVYRVVGRRMAPRVTSPMYQITDEYGTAEVFEQELRPA